MGRRGAERTGRGRRRRAGRVAAAAALAAPVLLGACTGAGDGDGSADASGEASGDGDSSGGASGDGGGLVSGDGLPDAMAAISEAVGGDPSRYTSVIVYPEYAIVEAQDPEAPDHIDMYTWRDGSVDDPDPVHLTGPQEEVALQLFPETNVAWGELAGWAARAEEATETAEPVAIEDPAASYVTVRRSPSDDRPIEVTVYVEGPRRSGYVEFDTTGEVLTTYVG